MWVRSCRTAVNRGADLPVALRNAALFPRPEPGGRDLERRSPQNPGMLNGRRRTFWPSSFHSVSAQISMPPSLSP